MKRETNTEPESGLAAELLSIREIARALKRLPTDRARVRAMQAAIAYCEDRDAVRVAVTKAPWRDAYQTEFPR